jgi:predicted dehydrogenase
VGSTFNYIGSRSHIKGISWYKSADYSEYNDVEDSAVAMVKFDNGATVFVETSWTQNIKQDHLYLELYGSKAGAILEPELQIMGEKDGYLVDWTPKMDATKSSVQVMFNKEIAHFVDCISNGTPCLSPGSDGLEIMKILDAIYKSAETGKEVAID